MKRVCAAGLAACLLLFPHAAAVSGPPSVSAASAILVDAESGRVLYEKDAHTRRLIASTTKLMTALVALEQGPGLEEEVTIPPKAAGVEGSSLYLKAGERLKFETLLYGMLLHSGNDAAVAVAVLTAGSVEAFAAQMNQKARELGMTNSHFTNPTGLDEEGHYSTARDLALLARACLAQETLAKMAATPSIALEGRSFVNHNKLLWRYEGCVGLKTGYTQTAGRTLVSAARRNGMTLIAVTLDDPNDWADHAALFDYGFSTYHMETALEADGASIPCAGIFILRQAVAPTDLLPALETEEGYIRVDRRMATNVEGVFAAGDCTGGPLQVAKAVGEGHVAALSACEYLDQIK